MRAAAALSEHPLAAHAVGEVAGTVLEALEGPIDLAFVFVESTHTGAMEDIAGSIRELLEPGVLLGSTACGVIGQSDEVEDRSAVSLWAATGIDAEGFRVPPGAVGPDQGWDAIGRHRLDASAVLLVDPYSCPALDLLAAVERRSSPLPLHGGFASAAQGPGGNRLVLDGEVFVDGGVGVAVSGVGTRSIVSQGCRPIGRPLVVTGVHDNVITELASEPPLGRIQQLAAESSDADRQLLAAGLHIGIAIDETTHDFHRGDFLIRGVLGADAETGAVAIGAEPDVGTTVQFQVRDADTASEDLAHMLDDVDADAALVFTCNGRGIRLFGLSGHDSSAIHQRTGSRATAGMFCAGELGPVGGANHLHGFTASTLFFESSSD